MGKDLSPSVCQHVVCLLPFGTGKTLLGASASIEWAASKVKKYNFFLSPNSLFLDASEAKGCMLASSELAVQDAGDRLKSGLFRERHWSLQA